MSREKKIVAESWIIFNSQDIEDVNEVQSKAYDRFLLSLTDLQILLVKEGE